MNQSNNNNIAYIGLVILVISTALILQFQGRNWLAANGELYF